MRITALRDAFEPWPSSYISYLEFGFEGTHGNNSKENYVNFFLKCHQLMAFPSHNWAGKFSSGKEHQAEPTFRIGCWMLHNKLIKCHMTHTVWSVITVETIANVLGSLSKDMK